MKDDTFIVQKTLEFAKMNLARPLSLGAISKATGYSVSWLETVFRRSTGKGILGHLTQLRVERAMALLSETRLAVTEIAFEVGFSSHAGFFRAFRRIAGISPRAYRKNTPASGKESGAAHRVGMELLAKEKYRDQFEGTQIAGGWKILRGDWWQENGSLHGLSDDALIALNDPPLPEHFRVTCEARVVPEKASNVSDLYFLLRGDDLSRDYCAVLVGCYGNEVGELRRLGARVSWNPRAVIKENQWMRAELELRDDTFRFLLDGEEMFRFRDAFPPSYTSRCRLALSSWRSHVEFRNLIVRDLGSFPLVNAIRQGDALFNAGSHKTAFEFYNRLAESGGIDTAELQYKTGVCLLRQGLFTEAHARFEKLSNLPQSDFWAQHARLADLEIDFATRGVPVSVAGARILFENSQLRGRTRALLHEVREKERAAGFHENALLLDDLLFSMEDPGGPLRDSAEINLGDSLFILRRFQSAEEHLQNIFNQTSKQRSNAMIAGFVLLDVYAYQGRFADARKMVDVIRSMAEHTFEQARCDYLQALDLCGLGQLQAALERLEFIACKYPSEKGMVVLALLQKALVQCSLGDFAGCEATLAKARSVDPQSRHLTMGSRSRFLYPIHLIKNEFQKAAEVLLEDGRQENGSLALRAEQIVKAGILLELGGEKATAKTVWKETSQRFPSGRVCFLGSLAENFQSGNEDRLSEMAFPAPVRSEMFYLAGLLYQSRGNTQRARELFRMSVQDDPRMAWPAYFSKLQLGAGSPT